MRRLRVTLAAVALAGLGALGSTATATATSAARAAEPSATPATLSNSTILNGYAYDAGLSMCLDAVTNSTTNPGVDGDPVQLWRCNGGSQQNWTFHPISGGWGTITNSYSGKCLDAVTNSTTNPGVDGDRIQIWKCNGTSQQLWAPSLLNDGWYGLINGYYLDHLRSDTLVLDAETDASHNPDQNGDTVQLWDPSGSSGTFATNQQWFF